MRSLIACPISGSQLPPAELHALALRAAGGDREAEGKVICAVVAIAWTIVDDVLQGIYGRRDAIIEDLFSDVLITVVKAIRKYDGRARLTTYLYVSIRGMARRYKRSYLSPSGARVPSNCSLDYTRAIFAECREISENDARANTLDPSEYAEQEERRAYARELLNSLPSPECEVISRRFGFLGHEETLKEVGVALGKSMGRKPFSREWVRQIENTALRRLAAMGRGEP